MIVLKENPGKRLVFEKPSTLYIQNVLSGSVYRVVGLSPGSRLPKIMRRSRTNLVWNIDCVTGFIGLEDLDDAWKVIRIKNDPC